MRERGANYRASDYRPTGQRRPTKRGRANRWRVWVAISRSMTPSTVREIAGQVGCQISTATYHVNALVDLGYVVRRPGIFRSIVPLVRAVEVPR